jgi:DNA repair exonuclease SbcCD ATPase subunit
MKPGSDKYSNIIYPHINMLSSFTSPIGVIKKMNMSISQACLMTDPAITAKQLVDLARKNIENQQDRIARQRELLAKYQRDDDVARLSGARLVLERMQKQLEQMTAAHAAAEEHLAKLTVDEASVEKVVRDTPM